MIDDGAREHLPIVGEERFELSGKEYARLEIEAMVRYCYHLLSRVWVKYEKGTRSREWDSLLSTYRDIYSRTHRSLDEEHRPPPVDYHVEPGEGLKQIEEYLHTLEEDLKFHQIRPTKRITLDM